MKDTTRNTKCRRSSSPKTLNQQKQQRSCKSLPTNCTAGCKRWKQPSWSDATNAARKKRWALPKRISSWKSESKRWKKKIKRKSSFEWKEWISGGCNSFFRCMPSEVRKEQRLRYTILYSKNQKNQTPRSEKSKGRKAVQNNFHEAFLQSFQLQNKNPRRFARFRP